MSRTDWRASGLPWPLAGLLVGWVSWGGRPEFLGLAALLPLLVALAPSRLVAFATAATYMAGMLRHNASYIASWYEGSLLAGAGLLGLLVIVSAGLWATGWAGRGKASGVVAMIFAWLLTLASPLSIVVPGHPIHGWAQIAPGTGWVGVVLCAVVPVLLWWTLRNVSGTARLGGIAVIGLFVVVIGMLADKTSVPAEVSPASMVAINTANGSLNNAGEQVDRLVEIANTLRQTNSVAGSTFVWPESYAGILTPNMERLLTMQVAPAARQREALAVVGADRIDGERLLNGALVFHPDGNLTYVRARQPAVLALWTPWKNGPFVTDWTADNILVLPDGRRAAVIFCYEEYLPILMLINEAVDHPDLYVAVANTWAAPSEVSSAVQTQHSWSMAKLFGRPYLKAENRPKPAVNWTNSVATAAKVDSQ